ncbi:unnamed protein product [Euphydryas editha]|uniref:DDE Tnp4 domain-containing protein n=1 Tax=Euphydryas editha TaxID=104508 RepID=A0AAU9VBJ6_EUPED|nr:unnamed protein product [Euphydryas editha]
MSAEMSAFKHIFVGDNRVLTALNFFAKGSYQSCIGNHKNLKVSQSTLSNCITEVVKALNNPSVFGNWVKFPRNISEMMAISQRFYELYRIPGVVGCIDCTHVAIHSPPNDQHYEESIYVNRKGYHSINTQLICDANLCIINVNALFPGSSHDSFIWNQSKVSEIMEQLHRHGTGRYYLIGDCGYPLRPWLHTPIPEPQPGSEENYNKAFKSARSTIERCNGVLKSRFPILIEEDSSVEEDESEMDFGVFDTIPQQEHRNAHLTAGEIYRNNIIRNYF